MMIQRSFFLYCPDWDFSLSGQFCSPCFTARIRISPSPGSSVLHIILPGSAFPPLRAVLFSIFYCPDRHFPLSGQFCSSYFTARIGISSSPGSSVLHVLLPGSAFPPLRAVLFSIFYCPDWDFPLSGQFTAGETGVFRGALRGRSFPVTAASQAERGPGLRSPSGSPSGCGQSRCSRRGPQTQCSAASAAHAGTCGAGTSRFRGLRRH